MSKVKNSIQALERAIENKDYDKAKELLNKFYKLLPKGIYRSDTVNPPMDRIEKVRKILINKKVVIL